MPLFSRVFPLWSFVSPAFSAGDQAASPPSTYPSEEPRRAPSVLEWGANLVGKAEGHWRVHHDEP